MRFLGRAQELSLSRYVADPLSATLLLIWRTDGQGSAEIPSL